MAFVKLFHVRTDTDPAGASLLSFRPAHPFTHKAGQFGLWIAGGSARPFTIASAPGDEFVQLGTHLHSGSRIKRALSALGPGDTVRFLGPIGGIAPPDDGSAVVYVTQGIGVTPARALIRERPARPQTLIHVGAPHFRAELEPLVDEAVFPAGRVDLADALTAAAASGDGSHFLVAGSNGFVRATSALLKQHGIDASHIHADGFLGLPDSGTSVMAAAR